MRRRPMRAPLFAVLVALLAIGLTAPAANAADTLQDRATTMFEVVPSRHVIHVTEVYTLANRKASTTTRRTCTGILFDPYGGTYSYTYECGYRTSYYYNAWSEYYPNDASHFTVKASSGAARISTIGKKGSDGWKQVKFTFSPLRYGQERTFTLQYDLPAGGPRSTATRVAGAAFATFCVFGPGTDKGRVRVVAPTGFAFGMTSAFRQSSEGGKSVWTSAEMKEPYRFSTCLTGTNPNGVNQATAGDIRVVGWKDDPAWAKAVTAAAIEDLPKVAAVLGERASDASVTVTENRRVGQPWDPKTGKLLLSEFVTDRSVALDALVSTWFDREHYLSDWVKMGSIRWAEVEAGVTDLPCTDPGNPPAGSPQLSSWAIQDPVGGFSDMGTALGAWKLQASCYLVKTVYDAIGSEKTAAVLTALRTAQDPYLDGAQRGVQIANWQDWLDTVTEVGLLPAGVDPSVVTDLAKRFGVTVDTDELDAHSQAVTAFHALEDRLSGPVPTPITNAMRKWDVATATALLASATKALDTAGTVPGIVAGVTVTGGAVERAILAATSQGDLDAAVALADKQVEAAKVAASVVAAAAQPLDTVQQIGLIGSSLPSADAAIAAAAAGDPAGAQASRALLEAARASATEAGTQRLVLGIGGIVIVIAGVAGLFVVSRRRRPSVASASATSIPAGSAPIAASASAADSPTEAAWSAHRDALRPPETPRASDPPPPPA